MTCAAEYGRVEVARLLVENGADKDARDHSLVRRRRRGRGRQRAEAGGQ